MDNNLKSNWKSTNTSKGALDDVSDAKMPKSGRKTEHVG